MHQLSVELNFEEFQIVENLLFELEDATHWNLYENFEDKGYWLRGVFENEGLANASWQEISELMNFSNEPLLAELDDKDWTESYKEHFKPWSIGSIHWVPLWLKDEYVVPEKGNAVWLDPGMAFGTGNHATTRLCVEQLIAFKNGCSHLEEAKVVDAGCGSGILAISAAKLGANHVHAFDNDPEAVRIAKENAALNGVTESYFAESDLVTGLQGRKADLVMANILANVLVEFSPCLVEALNPGGWLILSGILAAETDDVANRFQSLSDWASIETTYLDEWTCVRLVRA